VRKKIDDLTRTDNEDGAHGNYQILMNGCKDFIKAERITTYLAFDVRQEKINVETKSEQ